MNMHRRHLLTGASGVLLSAPFAGGAFAATSAKDLDRQAIKAMAGDFKVRFDFRETVAMVPDYTLHPPKPSGGHEVVRVIEDSPNKIVLQHLLVAEMDGMPPMVIKHWRQDWIWEPKKVLTYAGSSKWVQTPVPAANRAGAWSQTVWQTDDSPRYGGVGRWTHDFGESRWTSGRTWRPLARRDAIRNPAYDRYDAINRHIITPTGWVHLQDNAKIGPRNGQLTTIVQEDGLNTYVRFNEFAVAVADNYWTKSAEYWAAVRALWDANAAKGTITVQEEAQNGSVTGPKLMGLAEEIVDAGKTTAAAIAEARAEFAAKVS